MNKIKNNLIATAFFTFAVLTLSMPIVSLAAGPASVNLGTAGGFAVLAKTGVSSTGTTSIVGDIGVSPAAATYITGLGLILPSTSPFSTSSLVTGKVYASDYTNPTPSNLTTAVLDMQTAYTDAVGRAPKATELGAGKLGGMTFTTGVYKWSTDVNIDTDITLSGESNDFWIFQIAGKLNLASATKIILSGGAQTNNIFWVVADQTTIGTTAIFNGNILDQTSIVLNTGAVLNGRALAQTAVTLDSNIVTAPTSAISATIENQVPVVQTLFVPVSSNTTNQTTQTQAPEQNSYVYIPNNNSSNSNTNYNSTPTQTSSLKPIRLITTGLWQGNNNNDVRTLQQFLTAENKGPAAQALAKVGSTSYFGILTRAALAEFQTQTGIKPPLGNFGPITKEYISTHY